MLLKSNIKPSNIKDTNYNPSLLDNVINLNLKENNIDYIKHLGIDNYKIIYYVYLSDDRFKELIIYYYLLNFTKYKSKVIYMRNLNCVCKALKISNYVSRENHRFKGFLRFKELKGGILYAEIEPENNILELLSAHFKNRLKSEFWIIKDTNRTIISIYNKNDFYIFNEKELKLYNLKESDIEESIEDLWKVFYKSVGIKERKNDRCRMNFMPKKYWKNILEVSEEK